MTLPRLTSVYILLFMFLAEIIEMTVSYLYNQVPFLELFQGSTLLATFAGFFAALGMTAFVYDEEPKEDQYAWRLITWMIGCASIVTAGIFWGKYFFVNPSFSETEFQTVRVITATAVVYLVMGFITWRLVRNKHTETTSSSEVPAH